MGTSMIGMKNSIFSVLYMMVSETSTRPSQARRIFNFALFLIDASHVMGLIIFSTTLWPSFWRSFVTILTVDQYVIPSKNPNVFFALISILYCTVAFVVGLFMYTQSLLKSSDVRQVWPLRIMRLITHILTTAFFIPSVSLLLSSFSCDKLRTKYGMEEEFCWGGTHTMIMGTSTVAILLFLPITFTMSLTIVDTSPVSNNLYSKPDGAIDFLNTILRLVMVWIDLGLHGRYPKLHVALYIPMLAYMSFFIVRHLPYFHPLMNQLRLGAYATTTFWAVGTYFINYMSSDIGPRVAFTWTWMAMTVPILFATGVLLRRKYAAILEKMQAFRTAVKVSRKMRRMKESASQPDSVDDELAAADLAAIRGGEFEDNQHTNTEKKQKKRNSDHTHSNTKQDQYETWVASLKDQGLALDEVSHTVIPNFDYQSMEDVELYTRVLMAHSGSIYKTSRDGQITYARDAIRACRAVYEDGLIVFEQHGELNLRFGTFISTYCTDKLEALMRTRRAESYENKSLPLQFLTFARIQDFEKYQRASTLKKGLDSIALIELKKLQQSAAHAHVNALQHLAQFWKMLEKSSGAPSVSAISERINVIVSWKHRAEKAYSSLLTKFPNSIAVLRAYANYLRDVKDDEAGARIISARVVDLSKIEKSESEMGSIAKSSDTSAASSPGAVDVHMFKNEGEKRIVRMNRHVKAFILVIAIVMSSTFAYLYIGFEDLNTGIVMLNNAGLRRATTLMCAYGVRSVLIGQKSNDSALVISGQNQILGASSTLSRVHHELYLSPHNPSKVSDYNEANILSEVNPFKNPVTNEITLTTENINLWDFGNSYVQQSRLLATSSQDGEMGEVEGNLQYLYTVKNFQSLLEGYDHAVILLELAIHDLAELWTTVMISSTTLILLLICVMILFVFRPGITAVHSNIKGVVTIASCIPKHDLHTLRRQFQMRFRRALNDDTIERLVAQKEAEDEGDNFSDNESTAPGRRQKIDTESIRLFQIPTGRHSGESIVASPPPVLAASPPSSLYGKETYPRRSVSPAGHRRVLSLRRGKNNFSRSPSAPSSPSPRSPKISLPLIQYDTSSMVESKDNDGLDAESSCSTPGKHRRQVSFSEASCTLSNLENHAMEEKEKPMRNFVSQTAQQLGGVDDSETEDEVESSMNGSGTGSERLSNHNMSNLDFKFDNDEVCNDEEEDMDMDRISDQKAMNEAKKELERANATSKPKEVDDRIKLDEGKQNQEKDKEYTRRLKVIEIQTYGVFFLVFCLSLSFSLYGILSVNDNKYLGADLNNSGRRRMVSVYDSFITRECYVNDEAVFSTEECIPKARAVNQYLADIHNGIKHGNSSMRLKGSDGRYGPQDYWMYSQPCLKPPGTSCPDERPELPFHKEAVSRGLDSLATFYMQEVSTSLFKIEAMNKAVDAVEGRYDMSEYYEDRDFKFVDVIFTADLASGFGHSVALFEEETNHRFGTSREVEVIIFSVNIVLLLVMYILLLQPLIHQLRNQSRMTLHLLQIIPLDVLMEHASLRQYLVASEKDSLVSIAIDMERTEEPDSN